MHRRSDVLKNACEGHGVDEGNLSTALLQDERSGVRFVKACSYPCAHAHRNPDVANLARVADKVGVDARLVVTTRRAGPETKPCQHDFNMIERVYTRISHSEKNSPRGHDPPKNEPNRRRPR